MTDPRPEIRPAPGVRVVRAGGAVLAESVNAMEVVRPGAEETEVWFPQGEAGELFLDSTEERFEVAGLGTARRYDIMAKSGPIRGAAWALESPAPGAEALRDHTAFDTERVAVEQL
jgi:uncharacterized protein (DUF427 family)